MKLNLKVSGLGLELKPKTLEYKTQHINTTLNKKQNMFGFGLTHALNHNAQSDAQSD